MSTFSKSKISLTEMKGMIKNVYLPRAGAALFLGMPGISKTKTVHSLMHELQTSSANFGACSYNCGGAQATDMVGWPQPSDSPLSLLGAPTWMHADPINSLRGAFPKLCPADLVHKKSAIQPVDRRVASREDLSVYPFGVIHLDEATTPGDDSVWQPITQILREGRVGEWGVNERWCRIGTGNTVEDASMAREVPGNLRNGLAVWHVYATATDLAPYWASVGMHPAFIDFAMAASGMVFSENVPLDQSQFATARSWTEAWRDCMAYCQYAIGAPNVYADPSLGRDPKKHYACEALPYLTEGQNSGVHDPMHVRLFYSAIAARCGDGIAVEFEAYVKDLEDRPTLEDIVDDPTTAHVSNNAAVMHSTITMLVNEASFAQMSQVEIYLQRFPKALCAMFCQKFSARWGVPSIRNDAFMRIIARAGEGARFAAFAKAS